MVSDCVTLHLNMTLECMPTVLNLRCKPEGSTLSWLYSHSREEGALQFLGERVGERHSAYVADGIVAVGVGDQGQRFGVC